MITPAISLTPKEFYHLNHGENYLTPDDIVLIIASLKNTVKLLERAPVIDEEVNSILTATKAVGLKVTKCLEEIVTNPV